MVRNTGESFIKAVMRALPGLEEPLRAIEDGRISVDGEVRRNPSSVIRTGANIVLVEPSRLRGEAKLGPAIDMFGVIVERRVALDVGAAAGGFTKVLLARGAARVYAVDAGHGQLLGSLRQDPRVVNLEATNLADLNHRLVPDPIELFTLDLSYLSLTDAAPQLARVPIAAPADMIALVKPMFELRLPRPPDDRPSLEQALALAMRSLQAAGWTVVDSMESPVTGSRGAVEFLIHGRRSIAHEPHAT